MTRRSAGGIAAEAHRSRRVAPMALIVLALPLAIAHAQVPPQGPPGTVTLPLGEYNRLLDRAAAPPATTDGPPLPAVISRANLLLRAASSGVRGTITLTGEVFRSGPTRVPLLSGGILLDAQAGAAALPVLYDAGTYSAILPGPAPFSVVLTWTTEVTTQPGRAVAQLPLIPTGTARATIEVSGESTDVRVEPGVVSRRSASGGMSIVEAVLNQDRGVAARLSWSSRESPVKPPQDARLLSSVKSLVTIGENEIRLASLFEVSVIQGQVERLVVSVPAGFEVLSTSGTAIEAESQRNGTVSLAIREPDRRRFEFLIALERGGNPRPVIEERGGNPQPGEPTPLAFPLPALIGAQHETGEIAVEGIGAVDLSAEERGALRRLDPEEVSPALRALATESLLAAFRYQRQASEPIAFELSMRRYPNAAVLAAVADRATVTTLVTSEGRALTEIALTMRNQAQPFLKVSLPPGVTLVSAEVAGQQVKPAQAPDAARVPLLRPGWRPAGPYRVAFVYLQSLAAFARKGQAELSLARLDVPIGALEWELFLPERYVARKFQGDALPRAMVPIGTAEGAGIASVGTGGGAGSASAAGFALGGTAGGVMAGSVYQPSGSQVLRELSPSIASRLSHLGPDQVGGVILDQSGAVVPGATVTVAAAGFRQAVVTDAEGTFVISRVPSGPATVTAFMEGFRNTSMSLQASDNRIGALVLPVGTASETVTVTGNEQAAERSAVFSIKVPRRPDPDALQAPSTNVQNLQKRVAGVLPVRIDVPRAGHSYEFIRPLVVDEPTTLRFEYKAR